MAAWESMSDEAYEVAEDYALHVSPRAFYEWDGELDDAITEASILCDGITASVEDHDRIVVSIMAAEAAEAAASTGLRDALAECMAILDEAAA